ncbi:hypothetical protein [Flavihumibacter solisilvae]|uniref:Uncharacterized protein n=1 Tax=Flavihumibacter solisilvae TaxID=1349421 RepID=A0A0C1LGI3_9BACT|nr:hypothetical protein [Flavihumibacter solisilvae]KIC94443.1 hypothetical protein OI18_12630 [Flavihumibacter solisilvae]
MTLPFQEGRFASFFPDQLDLLAARKMYTLRPSQKVGKTHEMKYAFIFLLLSLSFSVISQFRNDDKKKQIKLIKDYALCDCIDEGFRDDSLHFKDFSATVIVEQISINPEGLDVIEDNVDSFISRLKPSEYLDTKGMRGVMINCIDYYNSDELDKLARNVYRRFR